MKYFLRALLMPAILFLIVQQTQAQSAKPTINHIAFHVFDLKKSTKFYQETIGLDTIPEPFHDGNHTWFSIGYKSHLHLIGGAGSPMQHDKNTHLCFTVPSVEQFLDRLKKIQWPFEDWAGSAGKITTRVDGVKQIYFRDPDGFWIEVNDAKE